MDIWFVLFVTIVALAAATGFSLVLVAYISVLPATFAGGRKWIWAVAGIPAAIVGIPVAVAFVLSPWVQTMPPAVLARWLAIPAGAVHVVALIRFFAIHWEGNAKTGKQLGGGLALLGLAVAMLYGAGPMFAERIVAGIK